MVIFLEIHIQIRIFDGFMGAEILRIDFLHQGITAVFLVSEDAADSTGRPEIVPHWRFDTLFCQCGGDFCRGCALQAAFIDVLNNSCLGRLNDKPPEMITIEAKRILNRELVDALRHAPADTSLNCLALLLGFHFSQSRQQRDQQIISPIAGIGDSLCLKLNGNGRVQGRKRSQIVQNIHDISTKTADAFGED